MNRQKSGGRRKGTPNKATADLKALAEPYSEEALQTLVTIMCDEQAPAAARLSAANAVLDRAYGKPPQAITGADGGPVAVTATVVHQYLP